MTDRQALRMSIGPVQGWIAAGRRTRDFWAGSFLLSRLAGEAMAEVLAVKGNKITVPAVTLQGRTESTLKAILSARDDQYRGVAPGPLVGTLVNHFRAEIKGDAARARQVAGAATTAVRTRFAILAESVWKHFFAGPAETHLWPDTIKARWDFQTSGDFFEILWVAGPIGDWQAESAWLDQRKGMRCHAPLDETSIYLPGRGDRCPVHSELIELGGRTRLNDRAAQDSFWGQVREAVAIGAYPCAANVKFIETLEIRPGERLSALALVKRLFPLLPADNIAKTIGWIPDFRFDPDADAAPAWAAAASVRALRNWPSTAFIAAIPWIIECGAACPAEADAYAKAQHKTLGLDPLFLGELPQHGRIDGINNLRVANGAVPLFAVLDGTLHHPRGLAKERYGDDPTVADQLQANFVAFKNKLPQDFPAAPSRFYALLDMDGDSMGRVFSASQASAELGSAALLDFANAVPSIVRAHDGVLIYAGADDVAAFLPTTTAIYCAQAIRAHWQAVMAKSFETEPPTISASIIFADYQNALNDMRRIAHERLDQIAKDGMGRDALAIAVVKSGGETAQWASNWDGLDGIGKPDNITKLAEKISHGAIASRLPYLIRDRFSAIFAGGVMTRDQMVQLLAHDMADSSLSGGDAKALAEEVFSVLQAVRRDQHGKKRLLPPAVCGLLLARFLASELFWRHAARWPQ